MNFFMYRFYTLLAVALFAFTANAQLTDAPFGDMPPPPNEYGKCYAKCKIADKYETRETSVLISGGKQKTKTIKPTYETVTERIMIKEGTKKIIYVPAEYETSEQRVLVAEGACELVFTPAKHRTSSTRHLVEPATGRWVRKIKDASCISDNPEDCYVMCYEEIPAKYSYDYNTTMMESERWDTIYKDPVYKNIKVKRIVRTATYREEIIEPVYKNITRKIVSACAKQETYTTPAKYRTKKEKVLVEAGYYTGWVEVLCAEKTNNSVIRGVQEALSAKGYEVGTVDGMMGGKTRKALEKFQTDSSLPIGNLNMQTLKALGLEE